MWLHAAQCTLTLTVEVDNKVYDHVLQLELPAGVLANTTWASTAFGITPHSVENKVPEQWMEYPFPTQPTHGFVATGTHDGSVCAACDVLAEYEAVLRGGQTVLRITLLRCVGWLSRPDLNTRKGNGGWEMQTPEAQCVGKHQFRVVALYGGGDWRLENAVAWSDRFLHAPRLQQQVLADTKLAPENNLAFVSQLPAAVRLSACKPAEDGKGIVLLVYNTADATQQVCLTLPETVQTVLACDLAEQRRVPADFVQSKLQFALAPWQIKSFYLVPGAAPDRER